MFLIHRVTESDSQNEMGEESDIIIRDVCVGYVCAKYNICSVVFDGYQSPSMSTQKACADF